MPQHNPEDRVRVRNIVEPEGDDIRTFWITRLRKEKVRDLNGNEAVRSVPYEEEIEWNFKDGFFWAWGGKYYSMKPGEERTMDRFMADHCAKHMVDHILAKRLKATRRMVAGVPEYDNGILTDEVEKKKIRNRIIVGVEEWYEANDEDFDTILNRKYGGNFDELAKISENNDSREIGFVEEVQQDDMPSVPKKPAKAKAATDDPELSRMRAEADTLAIDWSESDDASSIKARILKEMA